MHAVETLVVGAGQAGLAVSRCLTAQGADHVVVERGRIAERWRSARWDSLRLLTPSWMSRLPAWSYPGPDPDGYMAAPELVGYLQDYAGSFAAPVHENTTVELVEAAGGGLRVVTDQRTGTVRIDIVDLRGRPTGILKRIADRLHFAFEGGIGIPVAVDCDARSAQRRIRIEPAAPARFQ